jgi:phage terminase small subunit
MVLGLSSRTHSLLKAEQITPYIEDIWQLYLTQKYQHDGVSHFDVFLDQITSAHKTERALRSFLLCSEDILIHQLQQLAKILGKTPRLSDVVLAHKRSECASPSTFYKAFGSFNNALATAGLSKNLTVYTSEQLIRQLRSLASELGRSPKSEDIARASMEGVCASVGTFVKFFGSIHSALTIANLRTDYKRGYTRLEALEHLLQLKEKLGRVPRVSDLVKAKKENGGPSTIVFKRIFGSYGAALEAAGMLKNRENNKQHDREELLTQFRELAEKLGRTPSRQDLIVAHKEGLVASQDSFRKIFGSLTNLHLKAGIRSFAPSSTTARDIVEQLLSLADKLGRPPNQEDIRTSAKKGESASMGAIRTKFGSLSGALTAADLPITFKSKFTYTKEGILEQLQLLHSKIGRIPTGVDISEAHKAGTCASASTIRNVFGSLGKACEAAGFRPCDELLTKDELLDQIRRLSEELKKVPSTSDVARASKQRRCASTAVFYKHFGSFRTVLSEAGFQLTEIDRPKDYSTDALQQQITKLAVKLQRTPRVADVQRASRAGICASVSTFTKRFGTFNEAIKSAGMTPNRIIER